MIADVYEDNRGPSHAYQVNPGAFRNIHVEQQYRSGDDWTIRMFYRVKDRPQNYWLAYYHLRRLTLYDYQRHQVVMKR